MESKEKNKEKKEGFRGQVERQNQKKIKVKGQMEGRKGIKGEKGGTDRKDGGRKRRKDKRQIKGKEKKQEGGSKGTDER